MRFLEFKIDNYKGFLGSPTIRLEPGLNVIVGPNNVGKTALIEALSLRYGQSPHRSLATKPTRATSLEGPGIASVTLHVDSSELFTYIRETGGRFAMYANERTPLTTEIGRIVEPLKQDLQLKFRYSTDTIDAVRFAHEPAEAESNSLVLEFTADASGNVASAGQQYTRVPLNTRLSNRLATSFRERLYVFRAERLNLAEATISPQPTLESNASNLAGVLNFLQNSNPSRFQRFESFVRDIFPQIRQVTVPPIGAPARILLWPVDPQTERDDLAISLAESGTGIGQVLAILYVLLTSEQSRVILIDEPSTYLHPGAIRKLLDILVAHPQHQYVITTHSPTALVTSQPKALLVVRMDGSESTVEQIDPNSATDLRVVLADVGARLSDVFGADSILWVEGHTEELCFPLIRSRGRLPTESASGAVILAVRETGDFARHGAEATLKIYNRLSTSRALLPPAIGFIFDSENKSETEKADLRKLSNGKVHFLPRRMLENYFLRSEAIASLVNSISGFREQSTTVDEIQTWIDAHKWDRQYVGPSIEASARSDALWFEKGDGAALLEDLFKELSENRVLYDKPRHGLLLTQWLCENAFHDLADVATAIRDAITPASQKTTPDHT
jgi:predicted ATPase